MRAMHTVDGVPSLHHCTSLLNFLALSFVTTSFYIALRRRKLPQIVDTALMSSRQGGKQKPLKAPKKERCEADEDDVAFQQKLRDQKKAEKDAIAKMKK